jgi:hypothetical protein
MKYIIKLLIFPILLASCSDNFSQGEKVDSLRVIASNQLYHNYGKAITQNLNEYRKGQYDLDEIGQYLETKYSDVADLCKLDFSQSPIKGISVYMDNICAVNDALLQLQEQLPSYSNLSKEEKVRVHEIYIADFRDPANIYFNLNN